MSQQHPCRKIMTTREGYAVCGQAMKTTGSWQFSVRNPEGKLLGRTAARVESVFLHEKGDKKYKHPNPNYGMQWMTPGKAMYIVWRTAVKKAVK